MKSILELAGEVIRARRATYGQPDVHWQRTVNMVNAAFTDRVRKRLDAGEPMFAIEDWPLIMSLDKISRELGESMHRDNVIDIAGYMHGRDEILAARGHTVVDGLAHVVAALPVLRPCSNMETHSGPHEWSDGDTRCHCLGRERCSSTFDTGSGRTVHCQHSTPHPERLHEYGDEQGSYLWPTQRAESA